MTSAIFAHAATVWAKMREDYESYIQHEYVRAVNATNGVLVNRAGLTAGINGYDLLTGPKSRAEKYASEELIDYWAQRPRKSLAQFEREWAEVELMMHE